MNSGMESEKEVILEKRKETAMYDLIIIGAGPAGLTAGIYAQRAKLNTILLEKGFAAGGQVQTTSEVDNYPGLPLISGEELGMAFRNHALACGLPIVRGNVKEIEKTENGFAVKAGKKVYETRSVIVAVGAGHRKLGAKGEERLKGMGVSYCATCDGAFFRDKTAAVIGGGDVALEDAAFLARNCKKVYLIHRRDTFRGAAILQERVSGLSNVELIMDTVVTEICGENQVEALRIQNKKSMQEEILPVEGVFVAVGMEPNTKGFSTPAAIDAGGYLIAGEDCATDVEGLFAAGDVRTKPLRQIVTAAADGASSVYSVQSFFLEKQIL